MLVALGVVYQFLNRPDNVMRGGTSDVALIAPESNATTPQGTTRFVWHSVPGAIRYTLEVATPDGTALTSQETRDTAVVVSISAANTPEARWWIRAALDDGSEKRSDPRRLQLK
jgi:hypothetical protein